MPKLDDATLPMLTPSADMQQGKLNHILIFEYVAFIARCTRLLRLPSPQAQLLEEVRMFKQKFKDLKKINEDDAYNKMFEQAVPTFIVSRLSTLNNQLTYELIGPAIHKLLQTAWNESFMTEMKALPPRIRSIMEKFYKKMLDKSLTLISETEGRSRSDIEQQITDRQTQITGRQTATPTFRNQCEVCSIQAPLRVCSGCRSVYYCSPEHQKQDWPKHKIICNKTKEQISRELGATPTETFGSRLSVISTPPPRPEDFIRDRTEHFKEEADLLKAAAKKGGRRTAYKRKNRKLTKRKKTLY